MILNLGIHRAGASRRRIISRMVIFLTASATLASCQSVPSKPPILSPSDSQPDLAAYRQEFRQKTEKYYWTPNSPDQELELFIQKENSSVFPGGFYSLRLRDKKSGDSRILFTLWDADVDSGVRANVRWSKDGKAIQIAGDTRGFSYQPTPDAMKYESFNFIYLVEEDKVYPLSTDGV